MNKTHISRLKHALVLLCGAGLLFAGLAAHADQVIIYVHTDRLGNPVAKTDTSGAVIWRQTYTPYGETDQQPDPDGPGFTGHRHDAATGLTYMQARYYDPKIGRFLSPDPVTFSSGMPQQFNRYWYAKGNPYRSIDPDGKYTCDDCTAKQRIMVAHALKKIGAAASKLPSGSKGQQALHAVLKLYGKEDEKNGVAIAFGTSVTVSATVPTATGIKITFNPDAIHSIASRLGHEGVEDAAIVAHEGQHGVDIGTGNFNLHKFGDVLQTETNAFTTQSYVNEAEGVESAWHVWKPGITAGWRSHEIDANALDDALKDCPNMQCP